VLASGSRDWLRLSETGQIKDWERMESGVDLFVASHFALAEALNNFSLALNY
jgi:hypothetical protein